ncbi:DUF4176 domain-containing protein [Oliverpabstia intestinalis]|jgi:hypothetical protein|uniref:DUF4176 domain-containing protein n=1 Tax=Oliverpabstia intestinalis TaxID=2606633 RepID=UPI003070C7BC|nr:DUF4176 domain-containing protein [Lachnospiraceae bacterium]
MKFSELLPIGTVVLLKNAEKKLMIFGVGQTNETEHVDYDYIGVMYPEGNMGEGTQFLFNHSDIDQIFYRGYEDEEREEFINRIQKMYDEHEKN